MIIYIVLGCIYIMGTVAEKQIFKSNKKAKLLMIWNVFLAIPMWILISFRSVAVGTDTHVYNMYYERFSRLDLSASLASTKLDRGYVVLCNICGYKLGLSFIDFQMIIATIIIGIFVYFIYKHSMNFAFSWFLFMTFLCLARIMNITREMLAVAFSLIAFEFIMDKKAGKFIISVLLISLIHKSAVLLLFVLPLLFIKQKCLKKICVLIISVIVIFFFPDIMKLFVRITGRYAYLIESDYMKVKGGLAQYFNIVTAFLTTFFLAKYRNSINNSLQVKRRYHMRSFNDVTVYEFQVWENYAFLNVIFAFAGLRFGLADRAALYFSTINIVVYVNGLLTVKSAKWRFLQTACILFLMSIYFVAVMLFRNNWHSVVPYLFYWQ